MVTYPPVTNSVYTTEYINAIIKKCCNKKKINNFVSLLV